MCRTKQREPTSSNPVVIIFAPHPAHDESLLTLDSGQICNTKCYENEGKGDGEIIRAKHEVKNPHNKICYNHVLVLPSPSDEMGEIPVNICQEVIWMIVV